MNTLFRSKNPSESNFKASHSFEKRHDESTRIMTKYPDKIPVIVEKAYGSTIQDIDKKKYLVPSDLTLGQFVYIVRRRINLPPEQALFLFVGNALMPTSAPISSVYDKKKDDDGFLYITYANENTFGN